MNLTGTTYEKDPGTVVKWASSCMRPAENCYMKNS